MKILEEIFRRLESKDISAEEEKKLRAILDAVEKDISDKEEKNRNRPESC